MTENNEKKITTSINISRETHKWLKIYAALREFKSMGAAVEDIITDKRTVDELARDLEDDAE